MPILKFLPRVFSTGAVLALLCAGMSAQAALFKDAKFQALLDAGRYEELDIAAKARLKLKPDDAQALAAAAMANADAFDAPRLELAARYAQSCRERDPKEAACYCASAEVMGHQAQIISRLKVVGLVVRIKEDLHKALELDPTLYLARSKLVQLHLFTPKMLGGNVAKAKALEAEIRNSQPEHARLLRALIAAAAEKWPEAERELLAVRAGTDGALLADVREAYSQLGRQWLKEQRYEKARALYLQLQRDQPSMAMAPYSLARLALEQQQYAEAVRQIERAKSLGGAQQLPLDYRLGEALLGLGDKAGAKAAFEQAAADKRIRPNYSKDAREALARLV